MQTKPASNPAFPPELTSRRQWLLWKFVQKPGNEKPSKIPYYVNGSVRSGQQGSDADRQALATYAEATLALSRGRFDGLGFGFLPGDGLIGIDIDGAFDGDAKRQARAEQIIASCASFTEWSPSGKGVHIIVEGETHTNKSNDIGLEVFCGRQFFTMSGNAYPGAPDHLAPISERVLDRLHHLIDDAKGIQRRAQEPRNVQNTRYAMTGDQGKVEEALRYISPNASYDDWIRVGMAIKSELGDGGISVWEAWSRGSEKYQGFREIVSHWDSFRGNGVSGGTLFKMALESGWKPAPRPPAVMARPANDNRLQARQDAHSDHHGEIIEHTPGDLSMVDWASQLPDVTAKGKPLSTIENLAEIVRRLGVNIRYNVIKKEDEIVIPGQAFSIDNAANASLAWLVSACSRFGMPTAQIGQYATYLGDQNLYNPAAQYVLSKPWDGTSRLQAFFDTVTARGESQALKEALMRRWMISAIAAAFRPNGVSAHGVLVLQGEQNLGKTMWFKSLVPEETRLAQDGWTLRPDDKDNVKQACSFWLVELGELDATFRKSDIAALKSFLTRDRDVLRRPYAQRESEFARRTVFFASVNPKEFLHDPTGNRRYWTIECEAINLKHGLDMQQVWAEFYHLYQAGETWFLKPEESALLSTSNIDFEVRDPIDDRLMTKLNWQCPRSQWTWKTVTDVLISVGWDRPDRVHLNTAGATIRKLNGGLERRSNGKKLMLCPPSYAENANWGQS